MKGLAPRAPDSDLDEALTLKEPLRYLNLFRLVLAGVFLVAGPGLSLGGDSATLFFGAAFAYLTAVLILGFPDAARHLGMERLVTVQVGPLPPEVVADALHQGLKKAEELRAAGLVWFALLCCQGQSRATGGPETGDGPAQPLSLAGSAEVGSVFA